MAEAVGDRSLPVVADAFLGGRLLLRQPAEGHRCGTDAVLLAAAAPADFAGLAIDVGAGVGAAGLALAVARPGARIGLLENDPFIAGLARANLLQNGSQDRGHVLEADLLSKASRRGAGLRMKAPVSSLPIRLFSTLAGRGFRRTLESATRRPCQPRARLPPGSWRRWRWLRPADYLF